MRIVITTDAWHPQVNGVVRTLESLAREVGRLGCEVRMITPQDFRHLPCPTYPEIRLALPMRRRLDRALAEVKPDAIHIATEGPLGIAMRRWCLQRGLPFTTAFHTNFPEYIAIRTGLPASWLYPAIRRFHRPSTAVMVSTQAMARKLGEIGISHCRLVPRGVDTEIFRPRGDADAGLPRPVSLYVGRLAVEKGVEDFLALDLPGSKLVVGDGPARADLERRFPNARFTGTLTGEALAEAYASADVFVFPSRTDTFGLVMLEALASGCPVAAFPVRGPLDVIGADGRGASLRADGPVGCLDTDLKTAVMRTLDCRPEDCAAFAAQFSWARCGEAFLDMLQPLGESTVPAVA